MAAVENVNRIEGFDPAVMKHPIDGLPGFTLTGFDAVKILNLRDKTLLNVFLGSTEKTLVLIDKAREVKLDFEIYRPYLKRRLEALERARALPKNPVKADVAESVEYGHCHAFTFQRSR